MLYLHTGLNSISRKLLKLLDNNLVENAIRPFVIGRKNWLFSQSVKGVNDSANLYSLIETAKANRLEPYAYLLKRWRRLKSCCLSNVQVRCLFCAY